jgi:hypothetical protein
MIGLIGSKESKRDKLRKNFGSALFDCLLEFPELFVYTLIPIFCVIAICVVGIVVYQLIFDPNAVDVASRLDLLSIDPNKWIPRS